jgi:hypothetical protein
MPLDKIHSRANIKSLDQHALPKRRKALFSFLRNPVLVRLQVT